MELNKIKFIPIPISGVILSLFGLGLFFKDISSIATNIFTLIGIILIIFLLIKIILFNSESVEDLKNPVILGTFGTFPMSIMILGALLKDVHCDLAIGMWFIGFIAHMILIIYFTKEHILNFDLESVYTNYFVVFVGIGMASVTGAVFKLQVIVDCVFVFSFVSMVILLILVSYRYFKIPIMDRTFKPLVCIYAAPVSLVLCGFIQSSLPKSSMIIIAFYIFSVIFYIFGLVKVVEYIRLPFFPTFAAFTFPMVISSTATKNIMQITGLKLEIFLIIQITIAIIVVVYVLLEYLDFIITAP